MIDNFSIVVNTNSGYKDIWPMFFGQFEKYDLNRFKTYVFVDEGDYPELSDYNLLYYDKNQCFRDQYLSCIKQVPEEIVLTLNDDYVIYSDPPKYIIDFSVLIKYIDILRDNKNNYSFIRFTYTDIEQLNKSNLSNTLYEIPFYSKNLFSQIASIWDTRMLEKIYQTGPGLYIGSRGDKEGHFEEKANQTCMSLGIQGLVHYHNEKKRGIVHFDCDFFPYIASSLVKGKYNLSEYKEELEPLIKQYKIDINKRGIY